MTAAQLIEKESITNYKFVNYEVMAKRDDTESQIRERRKKLENSAILGNNYKSKVKITFATQDGLKQVVTTVWAVTALYVTLKSGIVIPIASIHDVEFC